MKLVRPFDLICTFEADGRVLAKSTSQGVGARLPGWAVGVLAFCSQPRTRTEVVQTLGSGAGNAFDGLAEAGLLLTPERAADTPTMFHNFAGIGVHRAMLADEVRLQAYQAAIRATVKPGDIVIDAGSGSGVLAVMAARAGAARVYAIERTDFADSIQLIARASGIADRVSLVRGDFADVALPEQANVLVTETFGAWALAEGALPDLAACAARNLAPGGTCIPHALTLWAAPMDKAPSLLLEPFRLRDDGVDLRPLQAEARGRNHTMRLPADIAADLQQVAYLEVPGTGGFEGSLRLTRPCAALACWYTLHLAPGVDLPTGPADAPTHWKQCALPIELDAGVHAVVGRPAPEDRRTLLVEVGGREVRVR